MKNLAEIIFNKHFGWGSITRCTLDPLLKKCFTRLKAGRVLEIGADKKSSYKKYVSCSEYKTLNIISDYNPDICCDIHDMSIIKSSSFDVVISIEVLEHCYNPQRAINEIYRILKPGGICILSTRFFHPLHPSPHDYYRFTDEGLNYLFTPFSSVETYSQGNRFHCIWKLFCFKPLCYILYWFNPLLAKIKSKKTDCPLGYVVYAIK